MWICVFNENVDPKNIFKQYFKIKFNKKCMMFKCVCVYCIIHYVNEDIDLKYIHKQYFKIKFSTKGRY